jgi:hypothetical protein
LLDLSHPQFLELRRLLAGLLHLEEDGAAAVEAEQVGDTRELVRPAVELHAPPAELFG